MSLQKLIAIAESQGISGSDIIARVHQRIAHEFQKGYYPNIVAICHLTGVSPTDEAIQAHLADLVDTEMYFKFSDVKKLTGQSPPESMVQSAYALCLEEGNLERVRTLRQTTGIQPSDGTVQQAYVRCLKKCLFEDIAEIQEVTGVKLNVPESTIQEMYAEFQKDEMLDHLCALYEFTNIKPTILDESVIQRSYQWMIEHDQVFGLQPLVDATGITPSVPAKLVQERLLRYACHGYIDRLGALAKATGVEPSDRTYELLIEKI